MKPGIVTSATEPVVEISRPSEPNRPAQCVEKIESVAAATGRDTTTFHKVTEETASLKNDANARDAQPSDPINENPAGPTDKSSQQDAKNDTKDTSRTGPSTRITFVQATNSPSSESKALYIPPPRARDNGKLVLFINGQNANTLDRTSIYGEGCDINA